MRRPRISLHQIGSIEACAPSWAIRGFLQDNSTTAVYGQISLGKSLFALSVAASVSTGVAFFGRKVEKPGLVIYIAGEGYEGIIRRYEAWCKVYGVDKNKPPLLISSTSTELCDVSAIDELESIINEEVSKHGDLRLLIIDTWSRNLAGDDNSQVDAERGIKALIRLCQPWRATCLIIAHEGHDSRRIRGSSALKGDLDHEIRAQPCGKDLYCLTMTKGRDIPSWDDFIYRIKSVDLGFLDSEGKPVYAGIIEEVASDKIDGPNAMNEHTKKANVQPTHRERVLMTLERMQEELSGGDGSVGPVDADKWRDRCIKEGIPQSSFYEAKNDLMKNQVVSFIGKNVFRNPTIK